MPDRSKRGCVPGAHPCEIEPDTLRSVGREADRWLGRVLCGILFLCGFLALGATARADTAPDASALADTVGNAVQTVQSTAPVVQDVTDVAESAAQDVRDTAQPVADGVIGAVGGAVQTIKDAERTVGGSADSVEETAGDLLSEPDHMIEDAGAPITPLLEVKRHARSHALIS